MASDAPIKRRVSIKFMDGTESQYTNEELTWCFDTQCITINNRYTGELVDLYPYTTIRKIHQESIK